MCVISSQSIIDYCDSFENETKFSLAFWFSSKKLILQKTDNQNVEWKYKYTK
jgi:hypothetical protein